MNIKADRSASEKRPGPSDWKRWLPWLPAALLVVVALVQIPIVHFADLAPWKGGGFGMFSTADRIGSRQMRVSAFLDGKWVKVRIPKLFSIDARRTIAMPTDGALDRFTRLLMEEQPPQSVSAVRVEVLRMFRDPLTGQYGYSSINVYKTELVDESG